MYLSWYEKQGARKAVYTIEKHDLVSGNIVAAKVLHMPIPVITREHQPLPRETNA